MNTEGSGTGGHHKGGASDADARLLEQVLDDGLGAWAGDEGPGVASERHAEEPALAGEVLDRLVGESTLDEVAEGLAFGGRGGAVGVHVEAEALGLEDVGDEDLGGEAGAFEVAAG
ncbi:MAG: hypothetical protein AAFP26_00895, partial [Planctomycetota bacterium]